MQWIQEWLAAHPPPPKQARPPGIEISYSQIRAFLECPWQYKLRYVDLQRSRLTPPAALGLSIHRTLEAFHHNKQGGLESLLDLYDENWVHAGFPSPQEQMEWYRKGERILKTYWEDETQRRSEIIHVEREFMFPLESRHSSATHDRPIGPIRTSQVFLNDLDTTRVTVHEADTLSPA